MVNIMHLYLRQLEEWKAVQLLKHHLCNVALLSTPTFVLIAESGVFMPPFP